ncbi:MAG: hypothetical protein ACPG5R_04115 [Cognaticolwellia aestuarii]
MVLETENCEIDTLQDELINQQVRMNQELRSNSKVCELPFSITATQFLIPSYEGGDYKARSVSINQGCAEHVKIIFSALNRANYLIFFENQGTETHKKQAHSICSIFIDFLNSKRIDCVERAKILKDFEAYRVNIEKVKPQSSGLSGIRAMIKLAIEDDDFKNQISESDYSYLFILTKTKAAPASEADNLNLAAWFSQHTWLRRDDIGIGHNLFSRLASPKATVKSFKITSEIAMLEILKAKEALMELFATSRITIEEVPIEFTRSQFKQKNRHDVHVRDCFLKTFDVLRKAYHALKSPSGDLKLAIKLFLAENIRENDLKRYDYAFFSNKPAFNSTSIVTGRNKLFFSVFFIRDLVEFVCSENKNDLQVPASQGEHILFHWLMATQTVQASDIAKLSRRNFRFVRRRNNKITHIQNEYYKGRAKTIHEPKEISTNTTFGHAVLTFILQRTPKNNNSAKLSMPLKDVSTGSSFARFINFLNTQLSDKIKLQLDKEKSSPVFLVAITKILEHGVSKKGKFKTVEELWLSCKSPCKRHIFKPSSIKTAAVYASSDTFDPTRLTNFHSHSDETERKNYLTPNNEEWLNNTGFITRAVMHDLTVNLFRASDAEKQFFNSHFTHAAEYISAKSAETLARMKLLTGKNDGRVDDLGFLSGYKDSDEPSDTMYLVDSAETVMKLRHFLSEVKDKHHILAKSSPEFLLKTVLPTVEWIETLFQYKRFSTVEQGDELYRKYGSILPPLFSAHLG